MLLLFITKLLFALVSLSTLSIAMFLILRMFDKALGINFKSAFDKIEQDPKAMSIYYGLRLLGVSLAVGAVVCFSLIL